MNLHRIKLNVIAVSSIMSLFVANNVHAAAWSSYYVPTGDGSVKQWGRSGGANWYSNVDETTCNNDTDYVNTTSTIGLSQRFTYDISSIPNGSVITRIELQYCGRANYATGNTASMENSWFWNGAQSSKLFKSYTSTSYNTTVNTWTGLNLTKNSGTTFETLHRHAAGSKSLRISTFKARFYY